MIIGLLEQFAEPINNIDNGIPFWHLRRIFYDFLFKIKWNLNQNYSLYNISSNSALAFGGDTDLLTSFLCWTNLLRPVFLLWVLIVLVSSCSHHGSCCCSQHQNCWSNPRIPQAQLKSTSWFQQLQMQWLRTFIFQSTGIFLDKQRCQFGMIMNDCKK